jgi:tetratricopeptide (TPR) repeat protein
LLAVGVVLGARGLRSAAAGSSKVSATMVAATGVTVVWFVDTSGDWMHLIPGVSAIALAAIAILCRGASLLPGAAGRTSPARPLPALAGTAAVALVLVIGGASLLRSTLVQRFLDDARAELAAHPAAAITDAQRALRLDSAQLDAYYLKAAGLARFGRAREARATLLAAAREDPTDFVTWTLLGDLEVRLADFKAARAYYRRAYALDPNDPSLAALVANPRGALAR